MKLTPQGPGFYLFLPLFLVFFALPYLFDIVFCEDLYTTQLSQAALIDAEQVEPHVKGVTSTSLDSTPLDVTTVHPTSTHLAFVPHLTNSRVRSPLAVLLRSRPPPAS